MPAERIVEVQRAAEIEVFYDGACPLCAREMRLIRRRDRRRRIGFVDIAAEGFDPSSAGVGLEALTARIHARLPDGTLVEGVEVFRRLYTILGLGWLVAPTRLPGVSQLLDLAYRLFARNRLRLTGRCAAQPGVAPGRLARCSPVRGTSIRRDGEPGPAPPAPGPGGRPA